MQAFAYCTSLEKVVLGEKLKKLSESIFFGCEKLVDINLEYIEEFEAGCLHQTAVQTLNIPSAKVLRSRAFYGMTSVSSVNALNVEVVEGYAFYGCSSLTDLLLPKVQSIGANAFYATKLNEFMIPETLITVEYLAFMGMLNLERFYALEGTEKKEDMKFENAIVDKGVLYVKLPSMGYVLSAYPSAKQDKNFIVMEGTERIEYYACSGNSYLETLTLPSTLKTIGNFGFYNTPNLKEVIFKSYFAPTLEGTMTLEIAPKPETFPKFDELYKYDYYFNAAGVILSPLNYQNFVGTIGQVTGLVYVYPENSEGYDTLLYKTYFDDKVDENGVRITSGKAIGKNAYWFTELCKYIPATVTWKHADQIGEIEFYYNSLLASSTELTDVQEAVLAKYLKAKEQLNASIVTRKLEQLFDVDNSKYSYDRIRDAYNAYSKLTEAEKVLVTNQAVLYEKISALEEELDEEIDFSKEYDSYKNAYKTDVEEAKPASTNWIVIVCSVLGGAMLIAAGILGFVILQKKRKQKERE